MPEITESENLSNLKLSVELWMKSVKNLRQGFENYSNKKFLIWGSPVWREVKNELEVALNASQSAISKSEEIQKEINDIETVLMHLKEEKNDKLNESGKLEDEILRNHATISTLENTIIEKQKIIEEYEIDIQNLQKKIDEKNEEINKKEDEIINFLNKVTEIENSIKQKYYEVESFQNIIKDKQREIEKLKEKYVQEEKKIDDVDLLREKRIKEIDESMTERITELNDLEEKVNLLKNDQDNLEKKIKDYKEEIDTLKNEEIKLNEGYRNLSHDITSKQQVISDYSTKIKDLTSESEELEISNNSLDEKKLILISEIQNLEKSISDKMNQLQQIDEQVKIRSANIEKEFQTKADEVEAKYSNKIQDILRSDEKLAEKENLISEKNIIITSLENLINDLNLKITEMTKESEEKEVNLKIIADDLLNKEKEALEKQKEKENWDLMISEKEAHLDELTVEIEKVREFHAEKQLKLSEINELENKLESIESKISTLEAYKSIQQREIDKNRDYIDLIKIAKNEFMELKPAVEILSVQKSNIESDLMSLKENMKMFKIQNQDSESKKTEYHAIIDSLEKVKITLEGEIKSNEMKLENIKNEVVSAEELNKQLEKRRIDLESLKINLEEEKIKIESVVQNSAHELNVFNSQINLLRDEKNEIDNTIFESKNELDTIKKELGSLRKEKETVLEDITQIKDEYKRLIEKNKSRNM